MPTILPSDTAGVKWHKLGEISKGLHGPITPVYPIVYSNPQKFTGPRVLLSNWSNRWAYNDSATDVVLTVANAGPAPMLAGQETYLYQASTGTITINPGVCTVVGPLATTGPGQLLVLKKISNTLLYSAFR